MTKPDKKPVPIVVRQAKPEDTSNVYRLIKAEAEAQGRPFNPTAALHYIASQLDSGYIAVGDLSGRIIGAVTASEDGQGGLELIGIFTLRGFEESGIDEALLNHIIVKAQTEGRGLKALLDEAQPARAEIAAELGMELVQRVYALKPADAAGE